MVPATTISVIVPVHNGSADLEECLEALQPWRKAGCELIVVDDYSTDPVREAATRNGARYFRTPKREGPAGARNLGVSHATGEILVFVDADVVVSPSALRVIREEFDRQPELAALFGSYDDEPRCTDFFSTFKNLLHYHVHQSSKPEAVTFWSGCGAIRRQAFEAVGGYNALRYPMASVEDIELGHRLVQDGCEVRLVKHLRAKHLKRWTLRSLVRTDIFQRAIPWAQLILRTGYLPRDLNLTWPSRVSAALVAVTVALASAFIAILLGLIKWPLPEVAAALVLALFTLLLLNSALYRLLWRKRGVKFATGAVLAHWAYLFYSGAAFVSCCAIELVRVPFRSPTTDSEPKACVEAQLKEPRTRQL